MNFQEERVADCLEELRPLHLLHWQETEGYRRGLKFNPDYTRLLSFNDIGYYRLFTAREGGVLMGNIGIYITDSMHTQTKSAYEDTLFIREEARKGFTASRFIRFVEQRLIDLGVKEINISIKRTNRVHILMKRLGYLHVGDSFTKIVGVD